MQLKSGVAVAAVQVRSCTPIQPPTPYAAGVTVKRKKKDGQDEA